MHQKTMVRAGTIFSIYLLLCALGCKPTGETMNLYNLIDKACDGKEDVCTLHLGQLVTDVEWDRVAFVRMQAWAKDPSDAIGVDALDIDEFEDLIVFARDRQAVCAIKRDYDPEVPYDHTVFWISGWINCTGRCFRRTRPSSRLSASRMANCTILTWCRSGNHSVSST
jgi:hypothetical protein